MVHGPHLLQGEVVHLPWQEFTGADLDIGEHGQFLLRQHAGEDLYMNVTYLTFSPPPAPSPSKRWEHVTYSFQGPPSIL